MRSNLRHPGNTTAISDNNAAHVARGSLGGTDFKDPYGTPVHAQLDGYVAIVDNSPEGSGGRYSRVTGNDGGGSVESLHQSSVMASRGQGTNPETVVGVSGASAYGSNYGTGGPHIHNHGVPMRNLEPYYWFLNGGSSPAGGTSTPIDTTPAFTITEDEEMKLIWDNAKDGKNGTNGYLITANGRTMLNQEEYNLFFRVITSDQTLTPFNAQMGSFTPVAKNGFPHIFTAREIDIMDMVLERIYEDVTRRQVDRAQQEGTKATVRAVQNEARYRLYRLKDGPRAGRIFARDNDTGLELEYKSLQNLAFDIAQDKSLELVGLEENQVDITQAQYERMQQPFAALAAKLLPAGAAK